MSTLRMPAAVAGSLADHLNLGPGEHFAFLLCRTTDSGGEPVFLAHDVLLIDDADVELDASGWSLSERALDDVINAAVRSRSALVEAHNHSGPMPRFSPTDRLGLEPFARFVCESLPGRPYGATVWSGRTTWGEWFRRREGDGAVDRGVIRSVTAVGEGRLHQLVSRDDDLDEIDVRMVRQIPWFTAAGQRRLARIRVGVVGLGGTGSQVALALAYLGVVEFVFVDDDVVEESNLNRVVTAVPADLGTPKAFTARRAVRAVSPGARAEALALPAYDPAALDALRGCDLIFGCVDNDGARLLLNRLALAYGIPLVDVATGIDVDETTGDVVDVGGRVGLVLPDGPCLLCMDEIDLDEARDTLATAEERRLARELGYVAGLDEPSPAVVSLNGTASNLAVAELAVMVAGPRAAAEFLEIDALGTTYEFAGPRVMPRRVRTQPGCFECRARWLGDAAEVSTLAPRAGESGAAA